MLYKKIPQSFRVGASWVREPWVNELATDDPSEGDGQALCVGIVEILHIVQGWAWTFLFAQTLVVDPHDRLGIREKGQFGRSSEERQWSVDLGHGGNTHGTQMSRAAIAVCYAFRQSRKNDRLIPEIGVCPSGTGFDGINVSAPFGFGTTAFHEVHDLLLVHHYFLSVNTDFGSKKP